MFKDPTGHIDLMELGWDYAFHPGPEYLHDSGEAGRAVLTQFQTYSKNTVQGGATPTRGGPQGQVGKMWSLFQSPQKVTQHHAIMADLTGGGVEAGQFDFQSLSHIQKNL